MPGLLGSGVWIDINGSVFDVKEGSIRETRSTSRGDIFRDGRAQTHHAESDVVNLTFKAIRQTDVNPHAADFFIAPTPGENDRAAIRYWPHGSETDPSTAWRFTAIWTEYAETFNAEQGLLIIDAACVSTGSYLRPGDPEPEE